MTDTNQRYRTHTCGELRATDAGATVRLSGWIHTARDQGKGLVFADLRDRYGMTQLTFRDDVALCEAAAALRAEWVVQIDGEVVTREAANPNLPTGEVEVLVSAMTVLNQPKELPIEVAYGDDAAPSEELRFRYRHLDLRRPEIVRLFELRSAITQIMHRYLAAQQFVEIETPILTRATPEGARDFLVPSRMHPGMFYALPQSPQLMKQILIVGGMDRYYQIARCFRDEDLRRDRQLEFTQLDIEMGFVTPEDVFALVEGLFAAICQEVVGREITTPFRRMSHEEAVTRYGIDRPDLRFGLELVDLSEIADGCGFGVFAKAVKGGGLVKAIRVPGAATYSRKVIEKELTPEVQEMGAKGLAWLKATDGTLSGSIAKFFAEDELAAIKAATEAEDGDLLLMVADKPSVVHDALGRLRGVIARREGLVDRTQLEFVWVVDFPAFRRDEETGQITYEHHPFTMPVEEDLDKLTSDPLSVGSQGYDLVLNGLEAGGGSIRIHRREIQEEVFRVLGLSAEEAADKFGWFLDTLDHGAPPHGGIAFGVDRIALLMASAVGEREYSSIRDVTVFPKTAKGVCPLTGAPSTVDPATLSELGVAVTAAPEDEAKDA